MKLVDIFEKIRNTHIRIEKNIQLIAYKFLHQYVQNVLILVVKWIFVEKVWKVVSKLYLLDIKKSNSMKLWMYNNNLDVLFHLAVLILL